LWVLVSHSVEFYWYAGANFRLIFLYKDEV
jgi:hypothetical protein